MTPDGSSVRLQGAAGGRKAAHRQSPRAHQGCPSSASPPSAPHPHSKQSSSGPRAPLARLGLSLGASCPLYHPHGATSSSGSAQSRLLPAASKSAPRLPLYGPLWPLFSLSSGREWSLLVSPRALKLLFDDRVMGETGGVNLSLLGCSPSKYSQLPRSPR